MDGLRYGSGRARALARGTDRLTAMLGRDVARRAADSALGSALAGRGRALFIAGEAGIGKTTLAQWVVEQAGARGALVRWGACWEGGSLLPFAAWIDAFRRPGGDRCGARCPARQRSC